MGARVATKDIKSAERGQVARMPNFSLTLTAPACRRRRDALRATAGDILRARGDGRPLAPAALAAFLSLAALFAQSADLGLFLPPSLILFAGLCLIALFDARYFVIPDGPLLVLGACGLAMSLASAPQETPARLAAAAAGYASIRIVAMAYERLRGTPGVGEGDAKLFALAGLWLGFPGLPGCLIYGVVSALLSAIVAIRQGSLDDARQPIPFGPHLALGVWLVWVFGPLESG